MKKDIILSGVGGQGIISIAAVIGMAALEKNLYVKQAEVHGMSQRGGAVQSHLRLSDKSISSDLIPFGEADLIISVEPMESLRYLPYLSRDGWLITNTAPFINMEGYPSDAELMDAFKKLPHVITLNADDIAKSIQSPRSSNIVILGAAAPFLDFPYENLQNGIKKIFGKKGEDVVNMNLKALNVGHEVALVNK